VRILAIDIGTGTQDILLFDSTVAPENCFKMVMPSPTAILASRVRRATAAGQGLVLSGVTMGGGPLAWALDDHLKHSLPVFATTEAARTLNDDLDQVRTMGVVVVSVDEARALADRHAHLELRDLDLAAVAAALSAFGVEPLFDALAVAVLDHGNAPPHVSDRVFRFDHIRSVVQSVAGQTGQLLAFAYLPADLPPYLTRMQAVVRSVGDLLVPMILLDTGAAAALGALDDSEVQKHDEVVLLNLGNMHALAIHLVCGRIAGLFEHHTGFLTVDKLDAYLAALIDGTLESTVIFADQGHGCLIVEPPQALARRTTPFLSVTGPRRALARSSAFHPWFAVPHGDMMLAGCFGLVRACARRVPEWAATIERALRLT
jgi:uncharacterized protein (DUF1786 family)